METLGIHVVGVRVSSEYLKLTLAFFELASDRLTMVSKRRRAAALQSVPPTTSSFEQIDPVWKSASVDFRSNSKTKTAGAGCVEDAPRSADVSKQALGLLIFGWK